MNNLNLVKLNTLCDKITDGSHYSPKGISEGIPMLSVKDMADNGFNYSNCKFITTDDYFDLVRGDCKPLKNDVLIAKDGSYLKHVFVIRNEIDQAVLSSIGILRPNLDKVNPYYLKYYLHTGSVKETVSKKYVSGSALPRIILKNFGEIEVIYKNLDEQIRIAKVLNDLDTKIELNNKINKELESMAKLIYDYWFVQFDFPVENGKPYKSSGGKMVYNEELKRDIPEGWEVMELSELESNIVTGKTPSTKIEGNFNGDIPFICIGDVRKNMHITNTELTLSEKGANTQANKYIPEGAICVSCIASPGLVAFATRNSQTNQQLNTVVCDKFENRYFLYFYLLDYFKFAKAKTGNTFANMNKADFSSIKVIKPNSKVLINFSNKLKSSIDKVLINSIENHKLAELRDWLLPMLMNSQVKIN
tara:strand:- start:397 stop:1653 length:1257 start_codon:yes stop_codon:yes gene_type:complete